MSEQVEIVIKKVGVKQLNSYAAIPCSFKKDKIFEIERIDQGLGGFKIQEKEVDAVEVDLSQYDDPMEWRDMFNGDNSAVFIAYLEDKPIGGAVIVYNTETISLIDGRNDLAVLWDIRVNEKHRGMGIGKALFKNALAWAKGQKCAHMKIETQNTNYNACKFFASQGCELMEINELAYYGDGDNDAMFCWYTCINV